MQTHLTSKIADPYVKFNVQKTIALFSFLLFVGKLIAYYLTNSVGILTDALESTVNVITGIISLYSIYISMQPKDANHPFGHGKAEFLSASVEGILIILAGLIIIFEAIKRLFIPSAVGQLDIGILIVALAGGVNYALGWYSIRIGRLNNSIALVSGGKHLQSDTYSSIGLVVGLILLYFTKMVWLDSVIALLFGAIIVYTGFTILKETTSNLMDEADFKLIEDFGIIIDKHRATDWIDIHNFKLIKYGNSFHVNCDLVLPWNINISEAHKEGEKFKKMLIENFSQDIIFHLHIDECLKKYCRNCKRDYCNQRSEGFVDLLPFNLKNFTSERTEIIDLKR